MSERIPAFYSPRHALHAPSVEFLHGRLIPYFEMPTRIERIKDALLDADLIELVSVEDGITREDALLIHDEALVDYIITKSRDCEQLVRDEFAIYHMDNVVDGSEYIYANLFPPTSMANYTGYPHYVTDNVSPIGRSTWEAVTSSAMLARRGADALLDGTPLAIALCRPPGHHAGRRFIGGYCYLNNAGLAAHRLKEAWGQVAILDVDYHHGNGTQDIFWEDADVLFASLHITPDYDYPHYSGTRDEIGGAGAIGTNLNYPLAPHTSVEAYLKTVELALDAIKAFGAKALVVSLGYDIYAHDQMGTFNMEAGDFGRLGEAIRRCNCPMLVVQEGGYTIDALGELAVAFLRGLSGE